MFLKSTIKSKVKNSNSRDFFFPVAVTENKVPTKSEKPLHSIPNSMIKMNDQDKSNLEAVIFEQVLESVGLR